MDAMELLVIILSTFLAVFLILAIILTIQLLRVTKEIQSIAVTTHSAVEKVNSFASTATKLASPAFFAKLFTEQMDKYKSKNSKHNKEDN